MDDAFRDYKAKPTSDGLVRLLRAHQDRVYRVCYHVLRRAHDAEDAAQEALIRMARGARSLEDSESFRRWVHRVSLNSALEFARKASRRRAHESRAAMSSPPQPLDEDSRRAVFEAIATLPEATRSLVLDRYAEGATLESLAAREGVSPQAVSKRLERAREELRKALPATLAAAFEWDHLFDAHGFAIPNLVTGSVLKVAAGSSVTAKLAVAGLLLAAAIGSGVAFLPKREGVLVLVGPTPGGHRPVILPIGESPSLPALSGPAPVAAESRKPTGVLEARLIRFRECMAAHRADYDKRRLKEFLGNQAAEFAYVDEKKLERIRELDGVCELVLENPDAFFRFLEDPANADCISELCGIVFTEYRLNSDGSLLNHRISGDRLPPVIVEGFARLFDGGLPSAKQAALSFFGSFLVPPPEFAARWPSAIRDADAGVAAQAVRLVWMNSQRPATREVREAVFEAARSTHLEVRREAATALGLIPGPESQSLLLERMETVTDPYELSSAVCAMSAKFYALPRGGEPVDESRFLQAALAIVRRKQESGFLKTALSIVLFVHPSKSRSVVEAALAAAPDGECRAAIASVLKSMDAGVTEQETLSKLLWPK